MDCLALGLTVVSCRYPWHFSSGNNLSKVLSVLIGRGTLDPCQHVIIWQIRFPRVVLAAVVGATLALGGLVFQALLRNPLAEPYILGISGGSAVGAIVGTLAGFSAFPGVSLSAFSGSMATLGLVLLLSVRCSSHRDSLLLGGVMMNAFCGAMIMFLIYLSQDPQIHHILFWLMGDLSLASNGRLPLLILVLPCFFLIFLLARPMNLLLMGRETAAAMGVNIKKVISVLLITTSFMVSVVVCQSGLVGFVGLVIPHFFRLLVGPDHRLLVPACILGGGAYLVLCDLVARTLPSAGEMPVGIITAMIGAPIFICLLWEIRK
ncbi:MAG: iron chelate uptake ABC transporter family permease subunit [Nitrospiraceae bacterium]|nr:iron chelate uptake ABC transporter family permease subunit [Nitrospiraceae bacterium]